MQFFFEGVRYTLYILMAFGFITPSIAECNIMQWWTDPCNVNPMLMEKLRHGRSVERQSLVVEQLKRSINMNRKLLKEIEKIYTNGVRKNSLLHEYYTLSATIMIKYEVDNDFSYRILKFKTIFIILDENDLLTVLDIFLIVFFFID